MMKYGYKQLIKSYTRVTKMSESIIDHIYTNRPEAVVEIKVPHYSVSDHYPVCITRYTGNKTCNNDHKAINYRSFKNFNEDHFKQDLAHSNVHLIENINNPNNALSLFYEIVNNILEKHAPIKEKRVKRNVQPGWFTDEIKHIINERDKCHKNKNFIQYKILRNKATSFIRKSKINFFNQAIKENKTPSYLWKHLKDVTNDNNSGISIPTAVEYNGDTITKSQEILETINDHFINIANIVKKNKVDESYFSKLKISLDYKLKNKVFKIKLITPLQTKRIIEQLNTNKSTGLDGIGPTVLKQCGDYIITGITSIINNSITQGIFPDTLKNAYVLPIHKGGSKLDLNNYRPISILPTISKVFERFIAGQLQTYFEETDILHKKQSGFRQSHSCHTALISLIDSWLKDVDEGKFIGTIFLDLRKAFDLVDHDILIYKLKLCHFSNEATKFFTSYLSNRKQLIKIGNSKSSFKTIRTGVPQGSILGPLLFLIYINDIAFDITSNIDLYADDSTVHKSGSNVNEIQHTLQINLEIIDNWCNINNMALHPSKTKCMLIGSKNKLKKAEKLKLIVNNTEIENVNSHKVLGICINNDLTWDTHISTVCSKLNSKLALLRRVSIFLTLDMKKMFYNAYIIPHFDYCNTIWLNGKGKEIIKLLKIQKCASRIILNKSATTSSAPLFKDLKWLTFNQRYTYNTAVLIYKALNDLTPSYIKELLIISTNSYYSLRSSSHKDIQTSRARTKYLRNSFTYKSREIWNNIPLEIRNAKSLNVFKANYKKHLFNLQS